MDNWNDVLTIIVAFATLLSWIFTAVSKSIRIKCSIIDWRYATNDIIQMFLRVESNTSLPFSVNSVSLFDHPCELSVKSIHQTPQGRIWETTDLPAYFAEGQARDLLLEFRFAQDISLVPGKTADLVICTNRHKLRRCLSIPEQGRRFRTLLRKNT